MDTKPAVGHREHIRLVVTDVPTLIFTDYSGRDAVVMYNEGNDIQIGYSGAIDTNGMTLANGKGFTDNYSKDEWWGVAASGESGTVSGFKVIGG